MPSPKAENTPMTSTKRDARADVETRDRRGAICLGRPTELAAAGSEPADDEAMTFAGIVAGENTNGTATTSVPEASGSVGSPGGGPRRGAISAESREELMTAVPRIVEGLGTLCGASGGEAGGAGSVPGEKEGKGILELSCYLDLRLRWVTGL
ncbi:hypothetical protein B0T18DRAFT_385672 [Schizothecium vesticola]|uniref:Uncharacterized protein n=1 Tax=Schizothecium vesticola TaxID=314040 RepID=A0AA40FAG2_9PEZI|nr:hypothetical protein B0T18DRAFT_385672 [Schizothecium vesticola]